jgi:hypothetical protein
MPSLYPSKAVMQLRRRITHTTTSFLNPTAYTVGGVVNGVTTHDESTMSWDVQIGSLKFPESPATSIPETFSLLRQCVGCYDESIRTLNLTSQGFGSNSFVIGGPLMVAPGHSFSGLNSRSGELITVRVKGMNNNPQVNGAGKCHVCIINEAFLEIREGSCVLLD